MTEKQWTKLQLRLSQLLREKGMVQVVIVERLDGTLNMQVVGGQTEVIR